MSEKEIKNEILKLGFNVNSRGVKYWTDAIKLTLESDDTNKIMDIYDYVAKKNNTTRNRVVRIMSYAIKPAQKNIQNKYGYYKEIKNRTFLNLIKFEKEEK